MISKLFLLIQLCMMLLGSPYLFSMNPPNEEEIFESSEPFTLEEDAPYSDDEDIEDDI